MTEVMISLRRSRASAPTTPAPSSCARASSRYLRAALRVKSRAPLYRSGTFGFGFNSADFLPQHVGDLDQDGVFTTDELMSLRK